MGGEWKTCCGLMSVKTCAKIIAFILIINDICALSLYVVGVSAFIVYILQDARRQIIFESSGFLWAVIFLVISLLCVLINLKAALSLYQGVKRKDLGKIRFFILYGTIMVVITVFYLGLLFIASLMNTNAVNSYSLDISLKPYVFGCVICFLFFWGYAVYIAKGVKNQVRLEGEQNGLQRGLFVATSQWPTYAASTLLDRKDFEKEDKSGIVV